MLASGERHAYSPIEGDRSDRFRPAADWFIASTDGAVYTARIGASAERVVDLLHALALHLDPAVDVRITDCRTGAVWVGSDVALPDVRDALGRLRFPLATCAGVEVTVFTPDDQLSLTPELLLVAYARSDRWFFLLEGMGLAERGTPPPVVWTPSRQRLAPCPDLDMALRATASRLGLVGAR
jgi:hypothetical protein